MTGPLLIAVGYLLGSIPFGLVLGKLFAGVDVRTQGSGNIGATNVARTVGKKAGVVVLLLDVGKGALAAWLALRFASDPWMQAAIGGAAIAGHIFPIWLKFRGGKGVATAVGVFAVLIPWSALVGTVAFALVVAVSRIVSLASLVGTTAALAATVAVYREGPPSALAAFALALIALRHRENIGRLLRGTENRL